MLRGRRSCWRLNWRKRAEVVSGEDRLTEAAAQPRQLSGDMAHGWAENAREDSHVLHVCILKTPLTKLMLWVVT